VPVEVDICWTAHRAGTFEVRLPGDLPSWFGGRFNDGRFGASAAQRDVFEVVTEPEDDPEFIVELVNDRSRLVRARVVARVPIGWKAVDLPFRRPRVHHLRGGNESEHARLFLREREPAFRATPPAPPRTLLLLELRARELGAWGNGVEVSVRPAGPGRYELTVAFGGARFECARAVVRGGDRLPPLGPDLVRPGPLGLLHARAAGVAFRVSRDGAWAPS
jgi:hypothetical protein